MNIKSKKYKLQYLIVAAILVLVTSAAYEPVRNCEFVDYDDDVYVTANSNVNKGLNWDSVRWAFTEPYIANWHSLTWLSHMVDCQIFGLEPQGHHLVSLLIHIANVLLLFFILAAMTRSIWPSAFVAVIFAIHPLHVESVAWIAERKDVLSTLFFLLTVAAYIRYTSHPSIRRYILIVVFFILGILSKSMVITLPFVLLLLDYWPLNRLEFEPGRIKHSFAKLKQLVIEKIPLFLLSAACGVITYLVQKSAGAMKPTDIVAPAARLSNAMVSYLRYIGKILYPHDLAALYPFPAGGMPLWQGVVAFLILILITAGVIYLARKRRYLATGWFWYVGTLMPVIGLVQIGAQSMADRYTYLPLIGFSIMFVWPIAEFVTRRKYLKVSAAVLAAVIIAAMILSTRTQIGYWKDSLTLFSHAVKVTQNNFIMHNNLGSVLQKHGQPEEALIEYEKAIEINKSYHRAILNKAKALRDMNKLEEAAVIFQQVADTAKNPYDPYFNLGLTYNKLGNYKIAIEYLQKALRIYPNKSEAVYQLALALARSGEYDDALIEFEHALELAPDWPEVHYNLAAIYIRKGKEDLAVQQCLLAIKFKPDYTKARMSLAYTYLSMGQVSQAIEQYGKILEIEPKNAMVMNDLAWIFAGTKDNKLRNPQQAVEYAQKACELTDYQDPSILDTLAKAYASAGNFEEAVTVLEKALKLADSANKSELAKKIQKRIIMFSNKESVEIDQTDN